MGRMRARGSTARFGVTLTIYRHQANGEVVLGAASMSVARGRDREPPPAPPTFPGGETEDDHGTSEHLQISVHGVCSYSSGLKPEGGVG